LRVIAQLSRQELRTMLSVVGFSSREYNIAQNKKPYPETGASISGRPLVANMTNATSFTYRLLLAFLLCAPYPVLARRDRWIDGASENHQRDYARESGRPNAHRIPYKQRPHGTKPKPIVRIKKRAYRPKNFLHCSVCDFSERGEKKANRGGCQTGPSGRGSFFRSLLVFFFRSSSSHFTGAISPSALHHLVPVHIPNILVPSESQTRTAR
jgi:hypothetical protein